MTYTVLLRTSPAGAAVHVLLDQDVLPGGDGMRYRLVCSTDDADEAERAVALMRDRIPTGELRVAQREVPRIRKDRRRDPLRCPETSDDLHNDLLYP